MVGFAGLGMDQVADELIARLRRNPDDSAAFSALKAHYQRRGDFASLANLVEGWAARTRSPDAAATAYIEAAETVLRNLRDRRRGITLLERAVERNPLHEPAWSRLQTLHEELGDNRRLVELLERRIDAMTKASADPRHVAAVHNQLGEIWERRFQRVDRAIFHYRQAFDLDPSLVPAIYAAREIYRKAGNLKAAATLYALEAQAEVDTTRKIALLRELGHLRSDQLGDLEGAIVALKRALGLAPGDLNVMHDLATALLRRAEQLGEGAAADEDRRRAADLLYQMAQSCPADHAVAYCEAALDAVADHDGALDLLETLARQTGVEDRLPLRWVGYLNVAPDAPAALERRRRLGRAYLEAAQIEDAIVCFEPLLEQGDPQAAELLIELYRQAGREGDLPRALEVAISGLPDLKRVPRLREMIKILVDQGRRDEAASRAREILIIDPADPEALTFLEDECRARQDWGGLRDLMLAAARVPGLSVDARKQRLREVAALSEQRMQDTEGAIGAWRAVTALDPADADARRSLAHLLEATGRWDDLVQVLEREALSLTDPDQKADVYARLAQIHREKRGDLEEAITALRSLREIRPGDMTARDRLCDVLLAAGAFLEAVPLVRERIDGASGADRIQLLSVLAETLEEKLGDDEGSFEASTRLLDEDPGNLEALARMERIDLKNERFDRLLETLSYRAEVTPTDERPEIFRAMGAIADTKLGDLDLAAEYYDKALAQDPGDLETLDALCDVYDRAERYRDLVVLLRERARLEEDASARAELYRRIARTMADRVRNEEAAAEAWQRVLEAGEDEEAIRYLRQMALKHEDSIQIADFDKRLAPLVKTREERRDLMLERAELLSGPLDNTAEAIDVLRKVVSDVEPGHVPALGRLAVLCERVGDMLGLADALERQLDITEDAGLRVPIARRLSDLYERELQDRPRAIQALYAWADADLTDPEPHGRLLPLLETERKWDQLIESHDSLAGIVQDPALVSDHARSASRLAVEKLGDVDGAWKRLVPHVEAGDAECERALRELAKETARGEALAELYVRLAQGSPDPREQHRRWIDAAHAFEEMVGDPERALEAMLRAFALDLGDRQVLGEVDRLAAEAEAWVRLAQVYEALVRQATADADKVQLLVRHAEILDVRSGDPSGALDRVLRAASLAPDDDDVLARAEAIAPRCGRAEELLIVYDRRKNRAEDDAARMEALLRAAQLSDATLQDRERALGYIAQGVALSVRTAAVVDALEAGVRRLDELRPELGFGAARRALIAIYSRLAEDAAEMQPSVGATLLLRAARILADELREETTALTTLRNATIMDPGNVEALDRLQEFADKQGLVEALDQHLKKLIQEALDSRTAGELLRRRGLLLEDELGRYEEAAEVYRQLLVLAPADTTMLERLRTCLRRAGKHQDLLVALDRQLERARDAATRIATLKEIATTWEKDLRNRWEAIDAWKRVLAEAPDDPEALDAVKQLGHSTRRLTAEEAADLADSSSSEIALPDHMLPAFDEVPDDVTGDEDEPSLGGGDDDEDLGAGETHPGRHMGRARPSSLDEESIFSDETVYEGEDEDDDMTADELPEEALPSTLSLTRDELRARTDNAGDDGAPAEAGAGRSGSEERLGTGDLEAMRTGEFETARLEEEEEDPGLERRFAPALPHGSLPMPPAQDTPSVSHILGMPVSPRPAVGADGEVDEISGIIELDSKEVMLDDVLAAIEEPVELDSKEVQLVDPASAERAGQGEQGEPAEPGEPSDLEELEDFELLDEPSGSEPVPPPGPPSPFPPDRDS